MANDKKGIMSDPKQRILYLTLGSVIVLGIFGGLYFMNSGESQQMPASATVPSVPTINTVPASSNSVEYNKKVQEQNDIQANNALSVGNSFVPTLTASNTISDISPLDLASDVANKKHA